MVRSAFFACLMLFALVGAASAQAFLTVHNNTDATLEVFVVSRFQVQDDAWSVTVPPVTAVRFAVEMGLFELIVEAPKVGGDMGFRRQISFLRRGEHAIEIFPADFGTTFLADRPQTVPGAPAPECVDCPAGGTVSGTGGDGKPYSASWQGPGQLCPVPYFFANRPFVGNMLNGQHWPNAAWGVSEESRRVTCR